MASTRTVSSQQERAEQKKRAVMREQQFKSDLAHCLGIPQGRRLIYELVRRSNYFQSIAVTGSEGEVVPLFTMIREGERNFAIRLMDEIKSLEPHGPRFLIEMLTDGIRFETQPLEDSGKKEEESDE